MYRYSIILILIIIYGYVISQYLYKGSGTAKQVTANYIWFNYYTTLVLSWSYILVLHSTGIG
jgi:hypothetical protein